MGFMQHKYTRSYFLKIDDHGNKTQVGVEGIDEFLKGGIRRHDEALLARISFSGKKVLDFGFGRGEAIKFALQNGASSATGVDFSQSAVDIAKDFLTKHSCSAKLHCSDALQFVRELVNMAGQSERFDVILMLDFVEHVPREELKELLGLLPKLLASRAVIAINTPVFGADNDVITEGLNPRARDLSDEHDETCGMHCNRYTRASLCEFMRGSGYRVISSQIFAYDPDYRLAGVSLRRAFARRLSPLRNCKFRDLPESRVENKELFRRLW